MASTDDIPGSGGASSRGLNGSVASGRARAALNAVVPRLPAPVWIYLITVITPIGFNLGPLAMTGMRLFLMVMIIPLMINLITGKYGKVFFTDILFTLHVLWMIPVFALNNPSIMVQQVGSTGIEFLGGYVVGRAFIRTPEAFLGLAKALVGIVFLTMPFALVELMTGRPPIIHFLRSLPGLSSVSDISLPSRMGLQRVQAVFSHPIHFGLFCSVAFSLCLVALKDHISTPRRYISAVIVAFTGFTALSSGGLLAIVLQAALILWAVMLSNVAARWKILAGIIAFFYVTIDLLSNRAPIDVFMSYATFSAHSAYWRSIIFEWGMKTVWNFPVFGIGWNDWVRPWFMNSPSVDNYWLLMAMRFGIPGFLLVVTGYALGLFHVMRRDFSGDRVLTQIRLAWVFTFLGLSFTLCTVHVWTYIYSFVFFMYGAGMFLITIAPQMANEDGATPVEDGPKPLSRYARTVAPPQRTRGMTPVTNRVGKPASAPVARPAMPPVARPVAAPAARDRDGPSFSRFAKRDDDKS